MMVKWMKIIAVTFLIAGCSDNSQIEHAKIMADKLLNDIALGTAYNSFPVKYFPPAQTKIIMDGLRNKCDFANRKGVFVNDFYQKRLWGYKRISFIYEYYLKCGNLRFILTYNLDDGIELYEFKYESIAKDNYMITKPERRLMH
jgi:hypothetical protein